MTDRQLKSIAREMRSGILGKRSSRLMCMAISAPLRAMLSAVYDFDTELETVDFPGCDHVWLRLSDGRILDATADQFGLDKIYLGQVPELYERWIQERKTRMKNSQLVTAYLNYCAETSRLVTSHTAEAQEAASERILSGQSDALWQACLDDGWTVAELNAAYVRRFGERG